MKDPKRFYTYAYLREDGTPYYIGKGCGKRIYEKCNREIKPPKDKSRIIFLKKNILEEEAFKHEIYMIAVFGRIDLGTGILRNKTNGGEGASSVVVSEENKRRLSEMWRGENNPNYGKVGENHPDYGKKWWNDGLGNNKLSIECPGEGWVLGMTEEHKEKCAVGNKDKKWWNDGLGNNKLSTECPGEGWVLGMSVESKTRQSKASVGKKWWNDGCGNCIRAVECPGEGWVPGRGKLIRKSKTL